MEAQDNGAQSMEGRVHNGQSSGQAPSMQAFSQTPSNMAANGNDTYNQALFNTAMSADPSQPYHFNEQNAAFLAASSRAPDFSQPATLGGNDFSDAAASAGMNQAAPFKRNNSVGSQQRPLPQHLNLQNSNHQFATDFSNPFPPQGDNGFVLDPSLQAGNAAQNQSINPADIMGNVSPPEHSHSPPNLMNVESRPSPHQSPSIQQGSAYSPNHSRHASLDPSSAGLPQGQRSGEWSGMLGGGAYRHKRTPSDHSDISSVASPYVTQDTFEPNHSPMLQPQQDPNAYQNTLGMERFTISEAQQQQQQQHAGISPRHSPYPSPRLSPHQSTSGIPEPPFILPSNDMGGGFGGGPGPQIFTSQAPTGPNVDMAQAPQMPPPEINVELAPPSGQENARGENDTDALSPPGRGRTNRLRAKSDPMSRPMSPSETSPSALLDGSSPSPTRQRSLSPFAASFPSSSARDASPHGGKSSSRRSSTSSIPNRDYILDLADPSRTPPGDTSKRVQKHPATFQCTLCPKRFTRAYNLRSHLRTHTDERPFVCTVCGKAFARQHDRKRHEGLHSGEKKFVCRGDLASGGNWGCGRRFARADALGRHFRSEAGRVCIKPLLDEEAVERQRALEAHLLGQQQQQAAAAGMMPGLVPAPPPPPMDVGPAGFALPAALLAQYPALQGLQWDQLGAPGPADEGELGGCGSFDASPGEYFDEDEGSGYVSGPGTAYGNAWAGGSAGPEWASDYEGH